jgi:hypothetical protein
MIMCDNPLKPFADISPIPKMIESIPKTLTIATTIYFIMRIEACFLDCVCICL